MSETLDRIAKFKHDELRKLLSQCLAGEIELFNRMYGSIDDIPEEKINWAIEQCERAIDRRKKEMGQDRKNEE